MTVINTFEPDISADRTSGSLAAANLLGSKARGSAGTCWPHGPDIGAQTITVNPIMIGSALNLRKFQSLDGWRPSRLSSKFESR